MIEIKFLKDLPCKLTNNNKSYINLVGGDVYYDKDGRRYAFVTFDNLRKKPLFLLQLAISEYDSTGTLLKQINFYEPNMYALKGKFVNNEPVLIEKECEVLEITIVKAMFVDKVFFNDTLSKIKKKDYIETEPVIIPVKEKPGAQVSFMKKEETFVSTPLNESVSESTEEAKETVATEQVSSETRTETPEVEKPITNMVMMEKGKKELPYKLIGTLVTAVAVALVIVLSAIFIENIKTASNTNYSNEHNDMPWRMVYDSIKLLFLKR